MHTKIRRTDGRQANQLRRVSVQYNVFGYAPGSVLLEMGNTKVLCTATLQPNVPSFLKGKKTGWLTAEYSMLPTSAVNRMQREASTMRRNGRAVEISRLISRSLRTAVNLGVLGERTIIVDCDVLQADGGTRVACITGASLALHAAQRSWLKSKLILHPFITDHVAAISVGIFDGQPVLDLDYLEDSAVDADFNIVMTKSGGLIELQGTAERTTLSWQEFDAIKNLAIEGIDNLFEITQSMLPGPKKKTIRRETGDGKTAQKKTPMFSLAGRLQSTDTTK